MLPHLQPLEVHTPVSRHVARDPFLDARVDRNAMAAAHGLVVAAEAAHGDADAFQRGGDGGLVGCG
jgi:hypothetical protein